MDQNKCIDPALLILEFLEVAIYCVLHSRKLYPEEIFIIKSKYGVPIHVSMYPELNSYITESLNVVKHILLKNELKQMDILFYNGLSKPIERFVFKINHIQQNLKEMITNDPHLLKLKELLRSFCLKLNINSSYVDPLPEDANFKIAIHTNDQASTSLSEDPQFQNFPWIVAEKVDTTIENSKLIPIRTIDHELFNISIYSEKSERK